MIILHLTHSLSTTFINTGIITVCFVTLAVTKLNKNQKDKYYQKGNDVISNSGKLAFGKTAQ